MLPPGVSAPLAAATARPAVVVVLLAALLLLAGTAPVAARVIPDPCFSCMELPSCAHPEPNVGATLSLQMEGIPQRSVPAQAGAAVTAATILQELEAYRRTFTLRWKQRAYLEVQGRSIQLGSYVPHKSNETWQLYESETKTSSRPNFSAAVSIRCKENAVEDRVMRVVASTSADERQAAAGHANRPPQQQQQQPDNITFTLIVPTNRACGLPLCESESAPLPAGQYLISKPPMLRQECPGTFLSSPSCKSGRSGVELSPLGTRGDRQRWTISAAAGSAAEGDVEADLVGQQVVIQNVARSARMCASHLSSGGSRHCPASSDSSSSVSVEHAGEQWLIERAPAGPAGGVVNPYYLQSKALAEAGCARSYLCLQLTCDATAVQLCSKDEPGFITQWMIRPTDISPVLAWLWGLY